MKTGGANIFFFLLLAASIVRGQNKEINDLTGRELKMTFPSVYFKNNSIEYAEMPQKADSILRFIAAHKKEIKSYVIWRDSTETEDITRKRIQKLKLSLAKYKADKINIQSMGNAQKISRYTINKAQGFEQNQYLLSLNSVFEVARTRIPGKIAAKRNRIFDLPCWMNPQLDRSGRQHCKTEKRMLRKRKKEEDHTRKKDLLSTEENKIKNDHIHHPRIWCIRCWRNHRFSKEYRQLHVR